VQQSDTQLIPLEAIEHRIHVVRGLKVMLDKDLAELYQVPTKPQRASEKECRSISSRFHVPAKRGRGGSFEVALCDLKNRAIYPIATGKPQVIGFLSAAFRSGLSKMPPGSISSYFDQLTRNVSEQAPQCEVTPSFGSAGTGRANRATVAKTVALDRHPPYRRINENVQKRHNWWT
jgi:hypothetical protein